MSRCVYSALLSVLVLSVGGLRAGGASISPIGLMDSGIAGAYSHAAAISTDGVWVVGDSRDESGVIQPFRWSAASGMQFLGNPSGMNSYATGVAVRNDGEMIVSGNIGGIGRRWSSTAGAWSALPPTSLCRTAESNALALNADGSDAWIVGSADVRTGCGGTAYIQGYRYAWSSNTRTGPVQGQDSKVYLMGLAADGSAAGYEKLPAGGGERAVYWPGSGEPIRIACLDGKPAQSRAISRNGESVVGHVTISGTIHAFKWKLGQPDYEALDALATAEHAYALATDSDGGLVGGYSYSLNRGTALAAQATIWDIHGVRRVADVLAEAGVDMNGWLALNDVRSISADGLTICGDGLYDPDGTGPSTTVQMAYVAVMPEPATMLLLILALLPTTFRPRRMRCPAEVTCPNAVRRT